MKELKDKKNQRSKEAKNSWIIELKNQKINIQNYNKGESAALGHFSVSIYWANRR